MAGLGIYHYNARFYSPKLGQFLSPDTIVPGAANPQAWNRYSYVLGNPLKYIDPSGHEPKYGEGACYGINCTNANGTVVAPGNGMPGGGGGGGEDDNGLPDNLIEELMDAGVSEDFLNSVTIVVDPPWWDTGCWSGNPAITSGNTITFCSSQYHDTAQVSPALVHELVHVHQYQEDPLSHLKIPLSNIFNADNNPYENEAYSCSDPLWELYYSGEDLPALNVAPCNLP